ncbi:hypothetical protein D3C77_463620 [compost metagenome]
MSADGQRLQHGGLIQRKSLCFDQMADRDCYPFPHAAVNMHAEDLHRNAAVGFAIAASNTFPAMEIGDNANLIAYVQLITIFANSLDSSC